MEAGPRDVRAVSLRRAALALLRLPTTCSITICLPLSRARRVVDQVDGQLACVLDRAQPTQRLHDDVLLVGQVARYQQHARGPRALGVGVGVHVVLRARRGRVQQHPKHRDGEPRNREARQREVDPRQGAHPERERWRGRRLARRVHRLRDVPADAGRQAGYPLARYTARYIASYVTRYVANIATNVATEYAAAAQHGKRRHTASLRAEKRQRCGTRRRKQRG
eukprot:6180212-Pleurochrysis_carterae.AAC.2